MLSFHKLEVETRRFTGTEIIDVVKFALHQLLRVNIIICFAVQNTCTSTIDENILDIYQDPILIISLN